MRAFDDKNAYISCLMQIGDGFCKRACRLPASIPRHNDGFERCDRLEVVWHEKQMTPGAEQQVLGEAIRLARSAVRPKCYEGVGGARHLQCGIGSIAVVDHTSNRRK